MVKMIVKWLLYAAALVLVANLVSGITVSSFGSALLAAVVIGLLNLLVRPVLVVLTLPVTVITLGLFLLVINALLFWFAGSILAGFSVSGFWVAVLGANGSGKSHFLRLLAAGGSEPDLEHEPVSDVVIEPVAHSGRARLGARGGAGVPALRPSWARRRKGPRPCRP